MEPSLFRMAAVRPGPVVAAAVVGAGAADDPLLPSGGSFGFPPSDPLSAVADLCRLPEPGGVAAQSVAALPAWDRIPKKPADPVSAGSAPSGPIPEKNRPGLAETAASLLSVPQNIPALYSSRWQRATCSLILSKDSRLMTCSIRQAS